MQGLLIGFLAAAAALGANGGSPRGRYEALVKEFDAAEGAAYEAFRKAADEPEKLKSALQRPRPDDFAPRFFELADGHPDDPAAFDALVWVVNKCVFGPQAEKALARIARDYGRSERIKAFCGQCSRYGESFPAYEKMLRAVLETNPHPDVQGAACLALADHLMTAKERAESNLIKMSLKGGVSGPIFRLSDEQTSITLKMNGRGFDKVAAESAALFQRVIDRHAGLRLGTNDPAEAGAFAKGRLFELRNLAVGAKAPEVDGTDLDGKPFRLSDQRGKVVVLDFGSHRSCGVCRQMYPGLRTFVETFKGRPVALVGVSVDDDVDELRAVAAKGETTWPILADGEREEGPLAARWVIRSMPTFYVIDPKGVIRNKGFIQVGEIEGTVNLLLGEMGPADALNPLGAAATGAGRVQ